MAAPRRKKSSRRTAAGVPEALTDASRGQRLHKVLATAGVASRRECERLIADGHVRVNRQLVAAMPAWVDPDQDRIEVDGRIVSSGRRRPSKRALIYVALHKPKNVISTARDPQGRTCVLDLVKLPDTPATRLYPIGRLDADSTGLILLTNDGDLANRLTHPRYEVTKQYEVAIAGILNDDDVSKLTKGLYMARRGRGASQRRPAKAAMTAVKVLGRQRDRTRGDRTTLAITLTEGQNREIRRLLARLNHNVRRLKRVAIGPLKLRGLAPGQWRRLTAAERRTLMIAAGLQQRRSSRTLPGRPAQPPQSA